MATTPIQAQSHHNYNPKPQRQSLTSRGSDFKCSKVITLRIRYTRTKGHKGKKKSLSKRVAKSGAFKYANLAAAQDDSARLTAMITRAMQDGCCDSRDTCSRGYGDSRDSLFANSMRAQVPAGLRGAGGDGNEEGDKNAGGDGDPGDGDGDLGDGGVGGTVITALPKDQEMLSCTEMWNKIQSCSRVQNGEIDMDELCNLLQHKGKCSGEGPEVPEKDFKDILNSMFAAKGLGLYDH